jgi:uncharacterized protein (TIGR02611 family)
VSEHPRIEKLRERRQRHRERSRIVRVLVAAGGFFTLAGGVALLVLPGPGLPLIVVGLGLLALEFRWAEAALVRALHRAEQAAQTVRRRSRRQKAVGAGVMVAGAGGVVGALARYGLPDLPF